MNLKKHCTGLKYTQLLHITEGAFKRPKIWSTTRMCLYEWDMVDRFLLNAKFFQIPHDILSAAKIYCIVLFCLKIILKIVQKVDTSYNFLEKFIFNMKEYNYGKKFMEIGLETGKEAYHGKPFNSIEIALKDYSHDKHMSALLQDLKKYVTNNIGKFVKEPEPVIRHTRSSQQGDVSLGIEAVNSYIGNLWVEVQSRLRYTDCSDGATSFSEAPAESIFSYYERIRKGRESLTLARSNILVRVQLEGPKVATQMSKELSKNSLKRHKSHLKERFTTKNWKPSMVSKTISRIQEGKTSEKEQFFHSNME